MQRSFPHDLDLETAIATTKEAVEHYVQKAHSFNAEANWLDEQTAEFSFKALGQKVTGSLAVDEDQVHIKVEAPGVLKFFESKAVDAVQKEINVWIEKAKA